MAREVMRADIGLHFRDLLANYLVADLSHEILPKKLLGNLKSFAIEE
jgi:hypothetical protein